MVGFTLQQGTASGRKRSLSSLLFAEFWSPLFPESGHCWSAIRSRLSLPTGSFQIFYYAWWITNN